MRMPRCDPNCGSQPRYESVSPRSSSVNGEMNLNSRSFAASRQCAASCSSAAVMGPNETELSHRWRGQALLRSLVLKSCESYSSERPAVGCSVWLGLSCFSFDGFETSDELFSFWGALLWRKFAKRSQRKADVEHLFGESMCWRCDLAVKVCKKVTTLYRKPYCGSICKHRCFFWVAGLQQHCCPGALHRNGQLTINRDVLAGYLNRLLLVFFVIGWERCPDAVARFCNGDVV